MDDLEAVLLRQDAEKHDAVQAYNSISVRPTICEIACLKTFRKLLWRQWKGCGRNITVWDRTQEGGSTRVEIQHLASPNG
jgi:hypothetical protein